MNDLRTLVAFLVAPLAVPLLIVWALSPPSGDPGATLLIVVSAFYTYVFSFLLGLPTYWFLRARQLTDFWIAPVAGAMIALISWYALAALFAISLAPLSRLPSRLGEPGVAQIALFFMLSGAAVGTIFWLIARPDRPRRSA